MLAPEDIRAGDYVAVLREIYELPSYWWSMDTCGRRAGGHSLASVLMRYDCVVCVSMDTALDSRDELVRIRMVPTQENIPLKVKSVCLPFVLAKQPTGERRTLDLRRCRLARLDKRYAAAAWKAYKRRSRSSSARPT